MVKRSLEEATEELRPSARSSLGQPTVCPLKAACRKLTHLIFQIDSVVVLLADREKELGDVIGVEGAALCGKPGMREYHD